MTSILVVDDNEHVRRLLRDTLEWAGYQVCEANNGMEAIDVYRRNQVDLIVLDMFMPEMDGFETIRILSHNYPDVKIIVISGDAHNSNLQDSTLNLVKRLGAVHVFEKPFDLQDLLEVIRKLHPSDSNSAS